MQVVSVETRLKSILELGKKLVTNQGLPSLLDMIVRESAPLLKADQTTLFLLDKARCELWSQSTLDGRVIRFDARLGIAGEVAMRGQAISILDTQQDPRFNQDIDARTGYETQTILAVPLFSPQGEVMGVLEAINKQSGAFTPLDKTIASALAAQAALAIGVSQALEGFRHRQDLLLRENTRLQQEVEHRFSTKKIIGTSEAIQKIIRLINEIRESSVDVLITGEHGTGKEGVAKAIHYSSLRSKRPFVALNCAVLPDNLAEAELFGIEKGVATGVEKRIGKFEQAEGGTLFLDEIGDLGLSAQAKLLRILQERLLDRIGGKTPIPVDVRILSATNKDLEAAIKQGHFRADLYYRLNVLQVHTPALREIRKDIPMLASHFLTKYAEEMKKPPKKLSSDAQACLIRYSWPGNTRQLENEMKRLVVMVRRKVICREDLGVPIREASSQASSIIPSLLSLHESVAELEKQMIREALKSSGGVQVKTAKILGLSRQGLIKKMKRYEIR